MLYESNSADGGDPAMSYRSGSKKSVSRRSQQRSEVDLKLLAMQTGRSLAGDMDDDVSSLDENDQHNESTGATLQICKSHDHRVFRDRRSLEKQLQKKLSNMETIDSLKSKNMSLGYDACEYLSEIILERASSPMNLIDLERCFADEDDDMEEQLPMAISTMFDAIEQKGVLRLNMAWTIINDTIAARIAESFDSLSMLQVLDLSNAMLRTETATIAQGLQNSSVRLR